VIRSLLLASFFILLNAFFVASEFAIVKVRTTTVEALARKGRFTARTARKVVSRLDAYLSATQVGITLASLGLGWVGESAFEPLVRPVVAFFGVESPAVVHSASFAIAFLVITFLHVVIGELVPKNVAIQHALKTTLGIALPLRAFYVVFFPLIWALNSLANGILRLVGVRIGSETELAHSEEELRLILAHSQEKGLLSSDERTLLEKVFEFGDRVVRQIMVPRVDVYALYLDRPIEQNLATIKQSGHTRYPVCEGDLDHVKGILNIKDLTQRGLQLSRTEELLALLRPVHHVPDTQPVARLLRGLQRRRRHMAIVVDEYGGTVGIVTLEDVLEEIVGEIQDEHDEEAPDLAADASGAYTASGGLLLVKLATALGIDPAGEAISASADESDTVGGYVAAKLGRQPRVGDRVTFGGHRIEVVRMKGQRVVEVRMRRVEPLPLPASETEKAPAEPADEKK